MWALTRSLTQAPTRCRAWPIPLTAGCGLPCLRRPGGGSGPFVVDAFATCASVQRHPATGQPLPYWTLFLGAQSAVDPLAAGMDAFTARWPGAGAPLWYAFPPVDWVGDLLRLLAQQAARAPPERGQARQPAPQLPLRGWADGLRARDRRRAGPPPGRGARSAPHSPVGGLFD